MFQNIVKNAHNFLLFSRDPRRSAGMYLVSSSLLRIKRFFQTCDVAELYLLVACKSSIRRQGLTFTSARVLARALFRASDKMTFGTPITSRPLGREVPLRSRAPVSCVTATVRMTVEEMCGLSLRLTCGHRVRALLVLAPPNPGALLIFCLFSEGSCCCFKEGLSSVQGLSSLRTLPATLFLSLCVSRRKGLSFAWRRGMLHCTRSSLSLRPRSWCSAVSSVPRITVFLSRELYFLTCPVSPWHDLLSLPSATTASGALLHQHTRELCLFFSSCGSRFSLLHLDVVY